MSDYVTEVNDANFESGVLESSQLASMHLVAHSLGSMLGLHLRRALGAPVVKMTLIDPDSTGLADFAESPPPTTILVGEKTPAAPFATARQLAPAFRAATLVVLGAAHMIPLTHPAAVVHAVRSEVNV